MVIASKRRIYFLKWVQDLLLKEADTPNRNVGLKICTDYIALQEELGKRDLSVQQLTEILKKTSATKQPTQQKLF